MRNVKEYCVQNVRELQRELLCEDTKKRLLWALIGSAIFCLAAHGYAFFSYAPLHDAVNYVDYHSGAWEVSLGRYMEPLYGAIRGRFMMPWFSGMLIMVYIGVAAFFVSELLDIHDKWLIMIMAGFLSVNATLTDAILEYSSFADMYALALMLVSAGTYFIVRLPNILGTGLGIACYLGSLGLYQSYIFIGVQLLLQVVFHQALKERRLIKRCFRSWLRLAAVMAITLAAYAYLYKRVMRLYGIMSIPGSYNSPAALLRMDPEAVLGSVRVAYVSFGWYFYGIGEASLSAFNVLSLMMTAAAGTMLVMYIIRRRLPLLNIAIIAAVIVSFPLFAQVTSILTLSYPIYFVAAPGMSLLFPFLLELIVSPSLEGDRAFLHRKAVRMAVYTLCGALLFVSVRISNGLYTYQRVQYDKTHSYLTRLMERIDTSEGYIPGETEVVFVGWLSSDLINVNPPEHTEWMSGMNRSGVTYTQIFDSYFRLLGEEVNVLWDYSDLPDYAEMEEVRAMPAYPKAGCTRVIDDRLIVKLAENETQQGY